jgi:hypothetical protein
MLARFIFNNLDRIERLFKLIPGISDVRIDVIYDDLDSAMGEENNAKTEQHSSGP